MSVRFRKSGTLDIQIKDIMNFRCPDCGHHLRNCIDPLTGKLGSVFFCHVCVMWRFVEYE